MIERYLAIFLLPFFLVSCVEKKRDDSQIGYVEADWTFIAAPEPGWIKLLPATQRRVVAKGDPLFQLTRTDDEREEIGISGNSRTQQRVVASKVAGEIRGVYRQTGEYVPANASVVAVLQAQSLKARFFVSQNKLPQVYIGQKVKIKADGLKGEIQGIVNFISNEPEFTPPIIYSREERSRLVFLVEAKIQNGVGLHPGLPLDISW